jgi:hypothetical protein
MNRVINIELLEKIPMDVVINNILPYTYLVQPKKLLHDIRSFYSDYAFLENIYSYEYNYDVLIYDLTCFCNRTRYPFYNIDENFCLLLKRLFRLKNYSDAQLNTYVFNIFHRTVTTNIIRKIRSIWALLRPRERTLFINNFLADNFY